MEEGLIIGDGTVKGAFAGRQITLKALDELDLIGGPEDAIRLQLIYMRPGMVVLAQRTAVEPFSDRNLLGKIEEQGLLKNTIAQPFLFDRIEFGRIFVGKNQLFRTETVLERVLAGGCLAFRATRTRATVGISIFIAGNDVFVGESGVGTTEKAGLRSVRC